MISVKLEQTGGGRRFVEAIRKSIDERKMKEPSLSPGASAPELPEKISKLIKEVSAESFVVRPVAGVREYEENYFIRVELPGVDRHKIRLLKDDAVVFIHAPKEEFVSEDHLTEVGSFGDETVYACVLQLPDEARKGTIEIAEYTSNGLLLITISKPAKEEVEFVKIHWDHSNETNQ